MARIQKITPFLWYDNEAEAAAELYVATFPNSSIRSIARYGEAGKEFHGREPGTAMTVNFSLDGMEFVALNGGSMFKLNESVSFVVNCESQEEVDHYWNRLGEGGDESAQRCGWLKDRFGLSWQIVPTLLHTLLGDSDPAKSGRAMQAMLQMGKLDIAELVRAFNG